jgi:hypothetical protein
MPFRFQRRVKIFPGVTVNLGKRGISSTTIGRTNFRKGYTPKTTIRLLPGLSWFFGGKRKRR